MNTATKTATHSVVTDQQLLDAFLEHIPDCVYFKDRDSRFVRVSRALADRFGLNDPLEAVNRTDCDMFSSEHAQQAFADEQEIIRTGQPIVCKEERETWRDGRETWVSTTKVPLRNREGEIIGTMGISRDITERRIAELELQQYKLHLEELVAARTSELTAAKEALERDIAARQLVEQALARKARELDRSNKDLEKFAYVASHDLQEPLRMVASYTQLLARRYKGKLDAEADEFIGFAVDGANRMKQLIQDLLAYSRLSTRGSSLEPTDSEAACSASIINLRQAIADARAVVTVDSLPTVLADASQLTQLFQNLIGNAIKYRAEHIPQIRVSAHDEGHDWIFRVSDNGIGIESQYFERIFEMFQRLHTRKEYAGTGIGLAICRHIVERHGGKIWVESQPGQGSKFRFSIPKRKEGKQ
jgi:PAS domain S-box-containing protein